ncbi:MAG TPA: hypothetical protein DHV36_22295 [Desulfobacteraceae bacterium]|nr:hypothetical protein [Desulfobacteraceae bacterium]
MNNPLVFKAGKTAQAHIRDKGLSPSDIRAVLGASGAAKWLGIYGLDRAIFSQWLPRSGQEIHLFGTSIGAWKLAAAAQNDPASAFDRLKSAYIRQTYQGKVTAARVTSESLKILSQLLCGDAARQICHNPRFKFGCAAARCRGLMAADAPAAMITGMACAFLCNLVTRRSQSLFFRRTLFQAGGPCPLEMMDFSTRRVDLSPENLEQALLASGSIPVVMKGVDRIAGAPEGTYRDGGILDYHPAFSLKPDEPGLILYPHFYPDVTPGWFDKALSGRRADGTLMDRTLLVAPSPAYIEGLPYGRIPDRKDFKRFQGRDDLRFDAWTKAAEQSRDLGAAFIDAVDTGNIRDLMTPF